MRAAKRLCPQLRRVSDDVPGIRRVRNGRGFVYRDRRGRTIGKVDVLARIDALRIPPAWDDVWICPTPRGHLQATGRDARGRKQYLYHSEYREAQESSKYDRLLAFAGALPRIRRRVARDLKQPELSRPKVMATIVRLLESTAMRVGNREYVKQNRSFGLTTLRDKHVEVNGSRINFEFPGKSGRTHRLEVEDPSVARTVRRCRDLPGNELFQFRQGDARHDVTSRDVNEYLRQASGCDFTAKDFRTWTGTLLATIELSRAGAAESQTAAKRTINAAVDAVARALGNTRAVCRRSYVHPGVIEAYRLGWLLGPRKRTRRRSRGLRAAEAVLVQLLERLKRRESRGKA